MAAKGLRERIKGDQTLGRIVAGVVSAPVFIWSLAIVVVAGFAVKDAVPGEEVAAGIIILVLLLAAAMMFTAAVWTFRFIFSLLTPPRASAMWLRRFQAEGADRYRVSRDVDGLGGRGIASLTLQDRDVQLSWEQRRARLGPVFWVIFASSSLVAIAAFNGWILPGILAAGDQRADMFTEGVKDAQGPGQFVAAWMTGFFGVIVNAMVTVLSLVAVIIALGFVSMLLALGIALAAGPIGAAMGKGRDDFPKLPALLKRFAKGGGPRGASVVRIRDENWRQAVQMGVEGVDAVIIDVSDVTEAIAWEIQQATATRGRERIVFIAREGAALGQGVSEADVVRYPAGRKPVAEARKRFQTQLHERLLAACGQPGTAKAAA